MTYRKVLLILIIILSLLFKSYRLADRYGFSWDQEDDALKTMSMVWNRKPLLIGPRVASENGFFAGPFHYYFLLPFYFLGQGSPYAGVAAMISIDILTLMAYFVVGHRLYGEKIGFLAAFIAACKTGLTSWNAMYIPLIAVIGYYLCVEQIKTGRYFYILVAFTGLAANLHLVPASLIPLALLAIIFSTPRPSPLKILKGLAIFSLFFAPLILFDLRHNFLNLQKLLEFISNQSASIALSNRGYLTSFWRSLAIFNGLSLNSFTLVENILILPALIYGVLAQKTPKLKIFSFCWLILPLIALSHYQGNIPEYYYGLVSGLVPLFLSAFLIHFFSIWIIIFLMSFILYSQFRVVQKELPWFSLENKIEVVKYIALTQKQDPIFNVSFNLPLGENHGFQYLFKYFRNEPTDNETGHLYTISNSPNSEDFVVFRSGALRVIRR